MKLKIRRVDWEFASTFRIAYRVQTHAEAVIVELEEDGYLGFGEALGVSYHGETADTIAATIENIAADIEAGLDRAILQGLLPAGGARNALDCALWDLESKRTGRPVGALIGLPPLRPLKTAFTIGLDTAEEMQRRARDAAPYSLLKLKLDGDGDLERVWAVKDARPDADIIVDANQSWAEAQLAEYTAGLSKAGVLLIEQPLPIGRDDLLAEFDSPVPLCADESCQTTESLAGLSDKYQYINIKLDKTGGLTEALRLAGEAKRLNFGLMVGCMCGSSLSMAPAFMVGQLCEFVDLDGPLLARSDVPHPIAYSGSMMASPNRLLWG